MSEQNRPPRYSGQIQNVSKDADKRKRLGTIILWSNRSVNPKAPVLTGKIFTKYGILTVSLWDHASEKAQDNTGD